MFSRQVFVAGVEFACHSQRPAEQIIAIGAPLGTEQLIDALTDQLGDRFPLLNRI